MNKQRHFKKSKSLYLCINLLLCWFGFSCSNSERPEPITRQEIADVIAEVTDVMVHDVTNPPLAARFYSYICLSGMEALRPESESLQILADNINGYSGATHDFFASVPVDPSMSAIFAMYHTAMLLQPSGFEHEHHISSFIEKCRQKGYAEDLIQQSREHGKTISSHILKYASQDGYNRTTSRARYSPLRQEGTWYPTPPGYFPPVEPYFNTLRPFFLDTAAQFVPIPPVAFSTDKNSAFFRLLEEVYAQELTEEKIFIASFWDCNPFALEDKGHLMIGLKKISPGAHWMGIANIACKTADVEFEKGMEVNTVLALTLHDSFMACWDEKYRSNRIRPETIIRKLIDPNYTPLLQTPPFPEYLSGHSVVSTASAEVLTHYFGDNFAYTDTVEVKYGLAARNFDSFYDAADEAAISRLYGGIHYMDAITEGQKQGKAIGGLAIQKLTPPMSK